MSMRFALALKDTTVPPVPVAPPGFLKTMQIDSNSVSSNLEFLKDVNTLVFYDVSCFLLGTAKPLKGRMRLRVSNKSAFLR